MPRRYTVTTWPRRTRVVTPPTVRVAPARVGVRGMPQTAGVRRRDSVRNGSVSRSGSSRSLAHSSGWCAPCTIAHDSAAAVVSLPARNRPSTCPRSCSGESGRPPGRAASSAPSTSSSGRPDAPGAGDDLVGVGVENGAVALHLACTRTDRQREKARELAEPHADPSHHLALMTRDLVRARRVEPLTEQHPGGDAQRDPAHRQLEIDGLVVGIDWISSSMSASIPASRGSIAFFRNAGATEGWSSAQSCSDWLKRFSPTPIRIGTTVAGGRVHRARR